MMNFSSLIRSPPPNQPLKFRLFSPIPPYFLALPHRSAVADEKYLNHIILLSRYAKICPSLQGFIGFFDICNSH